MPRSKRKTSSAEERAKRAEEWLNFRKDNLMTQTKLADMSGISRRSIQMVEAARVSPQFFCFAAVCRLQKTISRVEGGGGIGMETSETLGSGAGLNGSEILEDICNRLVEALRDDPDLRPSDSHQSFAAEIRLKLWLYDLDPREIEKSITVGEPGPESAARGIEVQVPVATASDVRARNNLAAPSLEMATSPEREKTVQQAIAVKRQRRWYTPRGSASTVIK